MRHSTKHPVTKKMAHIGSFACLTLTALLSVSMPTNGANLETGQVFVDEQGIMRWAGDGTPLSLFGANYCINAASDYRAARISSPDLHMLVDQDMSHFSRLGFNSLRLCAWGDWEFTDAKGNLIENEHLDLLDYLISKAGQHGFKVLLTPIITYNANWPENMAATADSPGFSNHFEKSELGTSAEAIAAQTNYIKQLLNHLNPYTGRALKDDSSIVFIEMINEPNHTPDLPEIQRRYIDALVSAVRETGANQLTFHNVSQDFQVAPAIRDSSVDGASFAWYPTGLVAGHGLTGSFLRTVDDYRDMNNEAISAKPRIVYEFDAPDTDTAYMYPAMARAFRAVGAQAAYIFAYDMISTAPFNLAWQTHYINLVHTPRKAISALIAQEAMQRLPLYKSWGRYPQNKTFGEFTVDERMDTAILNSDDAYIHVGASTVKPKRIESLERIAGVGNSPLINYSGNGAFFLDKIGPGIWRMELYPDVVRIADPYSDISNGERKSHTMFFRRPLSVRLPDLGPEFFVFPINVVDQSIDKARAVNSEFVVSPGVWLLTKNASLDRESLPTTINGVGFSDYYAGPVTQFPLAVRNLSRRTFVEKAINEISVMIASPTPPLSANLHIRPSGSSAEWTDISMTTQDGIQFAARLTGKQLTVGQFDYYISVENEGEKAEFPNRSETLAHNAAGKKHPSWRYEVISEVDDFQLLEVAVDSKRIHVSRPSPSDQKSLLDNARGSSLSAKAIKATATRAGGMVHDQTVVSIRPQNTALLANAGQHLEFLCVRSRAASRSDTRFRVRLLEWDGASWGTTVSVGKKWTDHAIPVSSMNPEDSLAMPMPYPNLSNFWKGAETASLNGRSPATSNLTEVQVAISEFDNPDLSWRNRSILVERIWLSDDSRCGA